MLPFRGLNTRMNFIELRRWSFLTCLMSLGSFIYCFSPVETVDRTETACSYPSTGDCSLFKLQCAEGEKIQILNAQNVLRDNSPGISSAGFHSGTGNTCNAPVTCDDSLRAKCCSRPQKAVEEYYSPRHLYRLLNECSWRKDCKPRAQYLNASSVLCNISYNCVPAKTHAVKFCQASNVTAERVHLVFENTTEFKETGNVSCMCNISSTGTYTIRAQDFRFQNAAGECTSSNVLTGFSTESEITCTGNAEKHIDLNLRQKQINLTGGSMFVLSVDLQNKPQMIWIEAKGETTTSTTQLTVQCFSVTQVPSTPISPTPVTANLTTSTVNESNTSKPLSSTAPVSSPTEPTFTSSQKTSTSPLTISTSLQTTATSSQTTSKTTSFITTHTTIIMTGHEPTEISSSSGSSVQHVRADDSGGLPVVAVVVPVIVLLLLGAAVVVYCWRKRLSRNADSKASPDENISDQQITRSEIKQNFVKGPLKTPDNYIVLEPENTYTYIDHGDIKDKTSPKNDTKITNQKSGQAKQQQISNPGYFVLEPENIPLSHRIDKKNESQNESTPVDSKEAATSNYFISEPHDTYSSIDPDDVVVQTLPENEYNVINMKGNPVSRDLNYGTLKTASQIGKDIEESGEYSHIRNNPDKKVDMTEYSHTNFTNAKP